MTHTVRFYVTDGVLRWECLTPWCARTGTGFGTQEQAEADAVRHLTA